MTLRTALAAAVVVLAPFLGPGGAEVQAPAKVRRIGLLCSAFCTAASLEAFRQDLREYGQVIHQ